MHPIRSWFQLAILTSLLFVCPLAATADDPADDNTGKDNPHLMHLYDHVSMIARIKYEYGKQKLLVKAVYPFLMRDDDAISMGSDDLTKDHLSSNADNESDEMDDGVAHVNEQVKTLLQDEITVFRNLVKQQANVQNNLAAKAIKNNLYIDYDTSLILSGDEHIISFRFGLQRFTAGMAHPYHFYHALNYNIDADEIIQLSDLFEPSSPYLNTLSDYTRQVLNKRLADKTLIEQGTAPSTENFSIWNIKPNGLLITFAQGQVAPYVNGAQTVLVPYSVLLQISASSSPLLNCIKRPKRCARYNLLTGGFIDEAEAQSRQHSVV